MTKRFRYIVAALAVLYATSPGHAQDWKGSARVSGKVMSEDRKPIADATLRFRHGTSNSGPDTKTNKKGEFAVLGIRGGTWNIDVEAPGYVVRKISIPVPEGEGRVPPVEIVLTKDAGASQAKELQGLMARGDELFREGKFAEARTEYEKVLAARPEITEIHRSIAFTYGREGKHEEALKHIDIVLQQDPSNPTLLQLAIASAVQLKDTGRASAYLAKLDESKLTDSVPLVNIAIAMLNNKQPKEAMTILDRAIVKFPDSADPYYFRALARLQLDQLEAGKADLEKFVSLAPADSKEAQQARELLSKLKK